MRYGWTCKKNIQKLFPKLDSSFITITEKLLTIHDKPLYNYCSLQESPLNKTNFIEIRRVLIFYIVKYVPVYICYINLLKK